MKRALEMEMEHHLVTMAMKELETLVVELEIMMAVEMVYSVGKSQKETGENSSKVEINQKDQVRSLLSFV